MHLTNETENRKIMCNKVVLKALLDASNLDGSENTETRYSAIVAIEHLADEVSNRQYGTTQRLTYHNYKGYRARVKI